MIIGIDPGSTNVGWAALRNHRLLECGLLRAKTPAEMHTAAINLSAWVRRSSTPFDSHTVVIECPQVYPSRAHWKGSPNDLIKISLIGGIVVGALEFSEMKIVRPHDWKGSVEKKAMLARIQKRLRPEEQFLVENITPPSLRHNAIDAVGIALYAAGRL